MIKLISEINGYGFNNQYEDIFSLSSYPKQDSEYLNTFTTINFKNVKENTYYPRFVFNTLYKQYIPDLYENSYPIYFRIVRMDLERPYKAILIGTDGTVIVTKSDNIRNQVFMVSEFHNRFLERANYNKFNIVPINNLFEHISRDDFFKEYNKEPIHEFPVQNEDLLGRTVWIEYDSNIYQNKTNDNIITTEDYETGEVKQRRNKYQFTQSMRDIIIKGNSSLINEREYFLNSYPHVYNTHAKGYADEPRRTNTMGIILRADTNSVDPHVVVMEISNTNTTSVRLICDDEARFYYDTEVSNDSRNFNPYNTMENYDPVGVYYQEESAEEEEIIEEDTNIEEETTEENNTKELSYDDVIIYTDRINKDEEEENTEDDTDNSGDNWSDTSESDTDEIGNE